MEMMWTAEIQILNEDKIYRRLNENLMENWRINEHYTFK